MVEEQSGSEKNRSALPPGVRWTPVEEAFGVLEAQFHPVVGTEVVSLSEAVGRIAAEPVIASRGVPLQANAAVDGYAYAAGSLTGGEAVPLLEGRAAAGHPHAGAVPPGSALRILTGAPLPEGVDTVVLQEEAKAEGGTLRIFRLPEAGANTRAAGEDVRAGEKVIEAGKILRPQDLAQAASVGVTRLAVFCRLRVGLLSTGDEIRAAGEEGEADGVLDANRPMLAALAASLGFEGVDLGIAPDREEAVREALDRAKGVCDALVVSGGASAGEEDHVARLLGAEGEMHVWRVAVKPGRPLVVARWGGVPVFALPGNPVAVFVCFLLFARPALLRLAGAEWRVPRRYQVPLAEALAKKPGRREYLRVRLNGQGAAERYHSEGSGLISGLRWSDGLVELAEETVEVAAGERVAFIPYSEFGIPG